MFDHRTKICLVLILIGLANFLAYAIGYSIIGGEAIHGWIITENGVKLYYLAGRETPVSRSLFIYSAIHSSSIWVTFAVVMLSMLTLAKDRIAGSMRSTLIRGRAVITTIAIIITLISIILTFMFVHRFAEHLRGHYTPPSKRVSETQ